MALSETVAADPSGLRVLHLDDGRSWRGGQHQVWLLMKELANRGVAQCLAVQAGSPLARRAQDLSIRAEEIRYRGELDPFSPARITRLAGYFHANILHAHTSHAHAIMLRSRGRTRGTAALLSTRRVDFPVSRNFLSRRKYNLPGQHFIAISGAVRNALVNGGVPENRIDLVHSGVPPLPPDQLVPREKVRKDFGIGDQEIAILNIGALTDHKGHQYLIEAAPQVISAHPAARFHIMGEGELRDSLQERIKSLNLQDHVVLHGFVPEARLKQSGFDLYASSSHLEGLGTSILDAMLADLPVVATATGGITDIICDDQTGILVRPADADALAGGLIRMINKDSGHDLMIQNAREWVKRSFSPESMAVGTLKVYRKIAAGLGS
jgi:glycosyltransferase involved in cell wall biosynthesis